MVKSILDIWNTLLFSIIRLYNIFHIMFCLIVCTSFLVIIYILSTPYLNFCLNCINGVVLYNLLEWGFEDHWQKEEHFQTGPRRVHCSWKDWECLRSMWFSCSSICSWGQFASKQYLFNLNYRNDFNDMQWTFGEFSILYMSILFYL